MFDSESTFEENLVIDELDKCLVLLNGKIYYFPALDENFFG